MDKEKILKLLAGKVFISQGQACTILNLSSGQVSTLIKKGIIEATDTIPPKPYLESVLEYKPSPNMKRHNKKDKT